MLIVNPRLWKPGTSIRQRRDMDEDVIERSYSESAPTFVWQKGYTNDLQYHIISNCSFVDKASRSECTLVLVLA